MADTTCVQRGYEIGERCDNPGDCAKNGCAQARAALAPTTPQGEAVLLPCPFCGGKATHDEPDQMGHVFCTRCHCGSPACNDRFEAALRWNRRAALAPPNAAPRDCDCPVYDGVALYHHPSCASLAPPNAAIPSAEPELLRLRKIAAHVPAKVYLAAKEAAGYGVAVHARAAIEREEREKKA